MHMAGECKVLWQRSRVLKQRSRRRPEPPSLAYKTMAWSTNFSDLTLLVPLKNLGSLGPLLSLPTLPPAAPCPQIMAEVLRIVGELVSP